MNQNGGQPAPRPAPAERVRIAPRLVSGSGGDGRTGRQDQGAGAARPVRRFPRPVATGHSGQRPGGHRRPPVGRGARSPERGVALPQRPGLHPLGNRHLRVFPEKAALRPPAPRIRPRPRGPGAGNLAGHRTPRPVGPVHHRNLPKDARRGHPAAAAGDDGALDAGRQAVGGRPGLAADRHARQRTHPDRHGELAAEDRGHRGGGRHPRHHGRADRGHAGRPAPHQDRHGRPTHGGRLHHQRHSPADRPDHRSSGRGPGNDRSPSPRWPMPSPWRCKKAGLTIARAAASR